MKKLVLTSVIALAASGAAFAQGTVNWSSITFAAVTAQANPGVESPFFTGTAPGGAAASTTGSPGSYYYELLFNTGSSQLSAPTTLAGFASWSDSGLEAENSATAGRLQTLTGTGASASNPGAANAAVSFTTASSILLVGWSADLGNTWAAAWAALNSTSTLQTIDASGQAYFGITPTGYITPNGATAPSGASLFGTSAGEIKSLNTQLYAVNPVPEPTTLALTGIGALSLLAFRRKNA